MAEGCNTLGETLLVRVSNTSGYTATVGLLMSSHCIAHACSGWLGLAITSMPAVLAQVIASGCNGVRSSEAAVLCLGTCG